MNPTTPTITLETLIRFSDPQYPEDELTYRIEVVNYSESVTEALSAGMLSDDPQDIIDFIEDDYYHDDHSPAH